jgi:hypothetical protein
MFECYYIRTEELCRVEGIPEGGILVLNYCVWYGYGENTTANFQKSEPWYVV